MASVSRSKAERSKKRDRTREQLLGAAMRVFAQRDVGEVSIREIATEAQVANGTFYNYFRTKDEVVAALRMGVAARFVRAAADSEIDDPAERAAIAIRSLVSFALEEPEQGWALVRIVDGERAGQPLVDCFLADLRAGMRCGRFVVDSERAAIDLAFGAAVSAMRSVLEGSAGATHPAATAELVLRGLGVAGAEAREIVRRRMPAAFMQPW